MRLRLSIGLLLAGLVLLASPVASGQESASDQKRMVDGRISSLQEKIQAAREREGVLSSEIEVVSEKIDALQNDVDAASARLNELETVLALHQRKLDRLNALYELQTRKLVFLQHQHKEAVARLSKRLVEIYTSERTSSISVVLDSGSFSDMLDQLEFLNTIGRQDHKIAERGRDRQAADAGDAELDAQDATAGGGDNGCRRCANGRAARRPRPARLEPARARNGPPRQADDAGIGAGGQGRGDRAHARPAGAERSARGQDPLRAELRTSCLRPPAPHRPPASSGRSRV